LAKEVNRVGGGGGYRFVEEKKEKVTTFKRTLGGHLSSATGEKSGKVFLVKTEIRTRIKQKRKQKKKKYKYRRGGAQRFEPLGKLRVLCSEIKKKKTFERNVHEKIGPGQEDGPVGGETTIIEERKLLRTDILC